ncbi:hypothetical protein V6N13_058124 [Hibiscus sabdariffa]|uniref:Uncharacterized protein n=1 Tax=Hibiscus sabdariffa TaxID=183260 RepID=A0ABR2GH29_9ROSI
MLGRGGGSRLGEQHSSGKFWLVKRRQTRPDVDDWFRLDDSGHRSGFGDRDDLRRRRQSRATASPQADASKKSFGHDNGDQRRVWAGRTVSAEPQPAATGMTATEATTAVLGFLG